MKKLLSITLICFTLILITSCSSSEDEGKLPNISFKTGETYTSSDVSLAARTALKIGINASKSENVDVLKKFNISKSVNGAASATVFDKDLTGEEGNAYTYDFDTSAEATTGQISIYTFTVTNRDGLVNKVTLKVTTL
jgi:hypothetical protein